MLSRSFTVKHLSGKPVQTAIKAGRADDRSELTKSDELNPWMMAKLKESYCQAKHEDDQRKSRVQQMMQKSTDFVRGHAVVFVPSSSLMPASRLHLLGFNEAW